MRKQKKKSIGKKRKEAEALNLLKDIEEKENKKIIFENQIKTSDKVEDELLSIGSYNDVCSDLTNLKEKQVKITSDIAKMGMPSGNNPRLTDHAIVQYMERILGYDMDQVRQQILTPERIKAIKMGATKIKGNGMELVVKNGTVVTVIKN